MARLHRDAALLAPGTGIGLDSNQATIKVISRTTTKGQVWILAENRSSHFHRAVISGLPRWPTTATLYPSGRTQVVVDRSIKTTFSPGLFTSTWCSVKAKLVGGRAGPRGSDAACTGWGLLPERSSPISSVGLRPSAQ